jgi:hypothetical protein
MLDYISDRTKWVIINDLYDRWCKDDELKDKEKNDLLKELKIITRMYEKTLVYKLKSRLALIKKIKKIKYINLNTGKKKDERKKRFSGNGEIKKSK